MQSGPDKQVLSAREEDMYDFLDSQVALPNPLPSSCVARGGEAAPAAPA